MRPHEERVEPGEDAEHLVGVLGGAELVAQARGDPGGGGLVMVKVIRGVMVTYGHTGVQN